MFKDVRWKRPKSLLEPQHNSTKSPPSDRAHRWPTISILVICLSRELASQAAAEATKLLKYHPTIGVQVLIGGTRLALEHKRMQENPCHDVEHYDSSYWDIDVCRGDCRIIPLAPSTSKARTTVLPLNCVVALVGSSYHRSTSQPPPVNKALCDIEAIYTFEGTYDINTLVTGRETTGILFALNQLLKKVGCESVKMCSSMD
ncbi:hypothetical protein JHK85_041015 [Glycine max]|nr:hypothetical protein JHK86_040431 [Glycine max]KAG4966040.1 hypothetical protein JHK85_041015 [Glycine max]